MYIHFSGSWRSGSASASHAEGHRFKSCTAHHLTIKSTPIYWGCFFVPWAVSKQTALLAAGFERRSVVFVCAPNYSAVRKAKTASPACRRFASAKRPKGKSCTAHHLIKSTPIYWGCFFVPWAHISHKPCRRDEELREMGQKTAFRRRIQSGKKSH